MSSNLNQAAANLIEALHNTDALLGFRQGLRATIAGTERMADPNNPAHFEALDALNIWRALDDLAAAVQDRRQIGGK